MRKLNAAALLLAVGLLAYFLWRVGWAPIADGFRRVGAAFFVLLGVFVTSYLVETWNWSRCFRRPIGLRRLLLPAWCGTSINQLTPGSTLGEVVKGGLLARVASTEAIVSSLVLANLANFYGTAIVILVGSVGLWMLRAPPALCWTSSALPLAALGSLLLLHRALDRGAASALLRRLGERRGSDRLRRAATRVVTWETELKATATELPRRFLQLLLVNLVVQALPLFELWLTWLFLGVRLDLARVLTFAASDTVIKLAFIFVPGSIGVAEGSTYITAGLLALDPATGLVKQLIGRSVRLVFSVAGAITLAVITVRSRTSPSPRDDDHITRLD
jgi:hypothetical protein